MAYQYGWMIKDKRNTFLIDTFATSKEECLDRHYAQNMDRTIGAHEWWASQRKEGYDVCEITIQETVKPGKPRGD